MGSYKEIDLSGIKTYESSQRRSKVNTDEEGKPVRAGMTVREFLDGLPSILKAKDLKELAAAVVNAKEKGKPVIAMLGGHVIKAGCSPVLADTVCCRIARIAGNRPQLNPMEHSSQIPITEVAWNTTNSPRNGICPHSTLDVRCSDVRRSLFLFASPQLPVKAAELDGLLDLSRTDVPLAL